ncbi:UDP-N-acetylmuramoyl-tripeptide--D-alanyl-D-alanine ligase [Effusibacillus lacus]|uniref:UDP-N-acetylmuramoyl-tripeptide--D-alanyl-D-alanine ligase n=1 Tax=Effusibacillus lacus TaxID=1348429 RepID=A0A292YRB2_9BACL|nr:UDP-N-acetylmuramoyl-tripeptide--D-alanyl-D-alanine ligase [Effusibacillus lacus]TCS75689.1 UDP-N-acetylmuramoyl-tripeptide--D-alanyl-D-alanine ligase [Effusibacillus lacus]GAX91010.1 UDP-N-acetylmuramoyl-tripeptide--D-alanyl-D-alanine ligase [Effusibacillus lacus]
MIRASIQEIVNMAEGELLKGDPALVIHGVSTDSRKQMTGCLFVPLIGERHDAHEFLSQAVDNGAVAALWQKNRPLPEQSVGKLAFIGVDDTLAALQKIAKAYRRTLRTKVVGVTGSNGKTSTKDMIAQVLSERFKVQKTQGNLNNHIGLPLMVLTLEPDTDVAVLEMGMSGRGEIALLADIAAPEIGVITNIGEAHIEFLGSREGIARAKFELIEALSPDGLALLHGDEPLLRALADRIPCLTQWFGFEENNDYRAVDIRSLGLEGTSFRVEGEGLEYRLPVPGVHQVGNALAAVAVGRHLGMSVGEIASGLSKTALSAMRMEVRARPAGGYIVNDAYNASPTSMKAALKMLSDTPGTDFRVAAIGDMLELGDLAAEMHYEVGRKAGHLRIDLLVTLGQHAADIARGAEDAGFAKDRIFMAETKQQAIEYIQHCIADKEFPVILVKASRGMKMEEIAAGLLA